MEIDTYTSSRRTSRTIPERRVSKLFSLNADHQYNFQPVLPHYSLIYRACTAVGWHVCLYLSSLDLRIDQVWSVLSLHVGVAPIELADQRRPHLKRDGPATLVLYLGYNLGYVCVDSA